MRRTRYDIGQRAGGCEGVARKPHTTPRQFKFMFIKFTCFLYRLSNKSAAGSNGKSHQSTDLHTIQAVLITGVKRHGMSYRYKKWLYRY